MPFGDIELAVNSLSKRAFADHAGIGAEPHRCALVGDGFLAVHEVDYRMRSIRHKFPARRFFDAENVSRKLNNGHLQPEADAEIRNAVLPGILHGQDLSLAPALAEPARNEDRVS
jgi:hypothetical protein